MIDFNKNIEHDLAAVNARATADPVGFIQEQEDLYDEQIVRAADCLTDGVHGCRIVWMCGPSSVGKTTTAAKLCEAIIARGIAAYTVSVDNFYLGTGKAPRLADGSFDYESPEALDLARLRRCLSELTQTGETTLPHYDFRIGAPLEKTTHLSLNGPSVVFIEGVHTFCPDLTQGLRSAPDDALKLFVNTRSRFVDGGDVVLSRKDIRLARRLLRDERTRASSFENTMTMWQQVLRGFDTYIAPYTHDADIIIDTTVGYEPCVLGPLLLERLHTLHGTAFEETARRFENVFSRVTPISLDLVPENGLLREFLG